MADPVLEQWEAARAIDQHIGYGRRAQQLADAGDALAEAYRAEREAHRSQQRVAIREMARAEKAEAYAEATEDEATKLVEQLRQGNERLRAALKQIARRGQVFDAKGTHSKWVVQTAREALANGGTNE